jgi:hypothetical protein
MEKCVNTLSIYCVTELEKNQSKNALLVYWTMGPWNYLNPGPGCTVLTKMHVCGEGAEIHCQNWRLLTPTRGFSEEVQQAYGEARQG